MQLAMIGLGRMGGNMSERLMKDGHSLVVFDRAAETVAKYAALGAAGAGDLTELISRMDAGGPRIVWIMVPAGAPVDDTITALVPSLRAGDVIIDGGNSNFRDTMRRASELAARSIHFMDCGTSGGIWGLRNGYCLMIGGPADAFRLCEPIFRSLAPTDGYAHVGPSGAGHFVKMIHNGIEYGMLQAYGEGYEILHATKDFDLDLHQVAAVWNRGSVVRSWLNELAESAFEKDNDLGAIQGYVEDSGEGRWTVQEAIALNVPAPVITLSLLARFRSRQPESFGAKVVAALRNEFGGHAVRHK